MDTWLDRMYERQGKRYLLWWLVFAYAVLALVVAPAITIVPSRYEGLSLGQTLATIAIVEVALAVLLALGLVSVRRELRSLVAWSVGERGDALAVKARAAAFVLPRRIWFASNVYGLTAAPVCVLALTLPRDHVKLLDIVEVSVGAASAVVFAGVVAYLAADLAMRPIRATYSRLPWSSPRCPRRPSCPCSPAT